MELVLVRNYSTLFLVKKENAVQFEFDDLTLESIGYDYFTTSVLRDERAHFDKKQVSCERGALLPCARNDCIDFCAAS